MTGIKQSSAALLSCGLALLLLSCGIGIGTRSPIATYRTLSSETRELDRAETAPGRELESSNSLLRQAAKVAAHQPRKAAGLYLEAAEQALPLALKSECPETILAKRYYRHGIGQAIALLHHSELWNAPLSGESRTYNLHVRSGPGLLDPAGFDSLTFADAVEIDGLKKIVRQDGLGAPMVGSLHYSRRLQKENPFLNKIGFHSPATALVEFSTGSDVQVSLYDTRRTDQALLAGRMRELATNFSLPLAMGMNEAEGPLIGLLGLLRPANFFNEMNLYTLEPLDRNRVPLVFIHGLGSEPGTWANTYNEILAEKDLRERYQVYVFFYPTGLPPMYPAAALKESLNDLHRWLKKNGVRDEADRMILIGHSMGGLLASTQIRDYRGAWSELFVSPIQFVPLAPTSREVLKTLFNSPPPRYVKRAVFVATPHRGSNMANSWLGRFISGVAKVPEHLLSLQLASAARSMTDLGRSIVLDADPIDSIHGLRYGNPLLRFNESRTVAPWIPYHSIIGDRGKGDTPNSSDGVVPYSSSHIEGAVSEVIIASHHSAHVHPQGIAEIKRILRVHLPR